MAYKKSLLLLALVGALFLVLAEFNPGEAG